MLEPNSDLLITVAARKGKSLLAIGSGWSQIKGRRCAVSEVDWAIRERFTSRRLLRATISRGSSCVHYRRSCPVRTNNALVRYRANARWSAHAICPNFTCGSGIHIQGVTKILGETSGTCFKTRLFYNVMIVFSIFETERINVKTWYFPYLISSRIIGIF